MQKAEQTQTDLEVALSILQNGLEQAVESGLPVKTVVQPNRVLIEVTGILTCGKCYVWTTDAACPNCNGGTQ